MTGRYFNDGGAIIIKEANYFFTGGRIPTGKSRHGRFSHDFFRPLGDILLVKYLRWRTFGFWRGDSIPAHRLLSALYNFSFSFISLTPVYTANRTANYHVEQLGVTGADLSGGSLGRSSLLSKSCPVVRDATMSSKFGVQFLALGHYYPSTERNKWCPIYKNRYHHHIVFSSTTENK